MIDVADLIKRYSVEELNQAADEYYRSISLKEVAVKPFRLPEAQHLLAEVGHMIAGLELAPGDHVMDFGCGTGWAGRFLNACGCSVVSVDVAQSALDLAGQLHEQWRAQFQRSGETLPLIQCVRFDGKHISVESNSIDKIFVLDAFHHVPDQRLVLEEFHRVLKPGGIAGFCEPGPEHSKTHSAQLEMQMHKVIENNIVIEDIWASAREIGFTDLKLVLGPLIGKLVDFQEYQNFPGDPKQVSEFIGAVNWRIRNYPIFFLHKFGNKVQTSARSTGLSCSLALLNTGFSFPAGRGSIPIEITNTGTARWLPSGPKRGSVWLGAIASANSGSKELRAPLSESFIEPGQTVRSELILNTLDPGTYRLDIDLVAEHVIWFQAVGSPTIQVMVEITA